MTSDPIGLAGGNNTYAYVENRPTVFTDTYGLVNDAGLPVCINGLGCIPGAVFLTDPLRNLIPPNDPGDPYEQCLVKCGVDFVNPIPDIVTEEVAKQGVGEIAKQVMKKVNKGKAAYDAAVCVQTCKRRFECSAIAP
ncbi:MAG: hypothetical protein AMJ69_10150 [Gammaproteobacteria bacterium SG8_47]|nr:MAG: hypothetical protein AMJ69_10150 [Gammaproteobacteria bacterium SG8_47]